MRAEASTAPRRATARPDAHDGMIMMGERVRRAQPEATRRRCIHERPGKDNETRYVTLRSVSRLYLLVVSYSSVIGLDSRSGNVQS